MILFEPRDGRDKQGNDIFKTVKGALLYGKNGTGKSTIAKAFRRAKGETQPAIKQISFFDKDGNLVVLSAEEKKHIFVFDEDFVNEKVKLKEDHLDTIIMLGQAADLAEKIEQAEKDRESAKTVFETKDAVLREYKDTSNPKAPTYRLWKVGNALRVIKRVHPNRKVLQPFLVLFVDQPLPCDMLVQIRNLTADDAATLLLIR